MLLGKVPNRDFFSMIYQYQESEKLLFFQKLDFGKSETILEQDKYLQREVTYSFTKVKSVQLALLI